MTGWEWGYEILIDGPYEEQNHHLSCHLDDAAVLKIVEVSSAEERSHAEFILSSAEGKQIFHRNEISQSRKDLSK